MFDRVLIQRAEAATKSKGGILIPEKAQQKVREGTVVAAGPGGRNEQTGATIPMVVKVGQNRSLHGCFLSFVEMKWKYHQAACYHSMIPARIIFLGHM